MSNKAVILDRDGTINIEKNYLYKIEEFEFIENVIDAIKKLNDNDYKVIVISNQAGIGRGYYNQEDVNRLHNWINEKLKLYNAQIDKFYYCPHHPEAVVDKYRINCKCRKPQVGLFLKAIEEFDIDVEKSFAVGDKISDLLPANKLGMKTILVMTGYGKQQKLEENVPDKKAENLGKAVDIILGLK